MGVAYLPDAPGGGKQGVDDFLASGKGVRDLEPFIHQGLREDLLPVGKPLSEIEPETVEWLWPQRIPRGKITVLDGDPDNGKSVLTTDLAARVTAGLDLPDGTSTDAAGAVIVSAEDGASDTIRPRFDAAGGDPSRALLLADEEPFAIPEDIPRLERAVRQVGTSLVVIDPIMAFLSGEVNSNRAQDVRRALTPLKRMAERTGAAVLLVRHPNKAQGGNPLYRGRERPLQDARRPLHRPEDGGGPKAHSGVEPRPQQTHTAPGKAGQARKGNTTGVYPLSPWERRERGGLYYTRSRKEGGRVIREYVGGGTLGELAARMDAEERQRREEQAARWRDEQAGLDALDDPVAELMGASDLLVRAALLASEYHQHNRGEWRLRRGPKESE